MELYVYKVIYPNGVYVRLTPDLNAEKTGDVLPFGSIIESTKSLILDGINYVQLKDGKGWVFSSKGERSVLDLIEVIRTNKEDPMTIQSSNPKLSTPQKELNPDNNYSKAETPRRKPTLHILPSTPSSSKKITQNQNIWKEIRGQVRNTLSFNDLSIILTNESYSVVFPPKVTEPGPARCAWLTSSEGLDHKLRVIVSVLASITRQCIDNIADVTGLEQHLWLFVNLGPQDVHYILSLADEAAKLSFDRLSQGLRAELLNHTNELARLTKVQSIEASKLSELLSDDIRHFLQRWTCIKAYNRKVPIDIRFEKDAYPNTQTSDASNPSGIFTRTILLANNLMTNLGGCNIRSDAENMLNSSTESFKTFLDSCENYIVDLFEK